MKKQYLLLFILFFFLRNLFSQPQVLPLNKNYSLAVTQAATYKKSIIHTPFKPFIYDNILYADSVIAKSVLSFPSKKESNRSLFIRKLKYENFIYLNKKDIIIRIDPLFHFETGRETMTTDYKLFINTRGIHVRGELGKDFYFESRFYENQGFYPNYIRSYILSQRVVPGQGRIRAYKIYGFDFSSSSGFISYSPCKSINIQFGHGKNFIGDGYQSLLLSDNTYNYPFAKITFTHKRWQYTTLWTAFTNVFMQDNRNVIYQTKHGTFSYLNFIATNWFQVGFFEGFIWHTSDIDYNNRFNANYFIPILGYKTLAYGLNNANNGILGINANSRIGKHFKLYGQWIIDDIKRNPFTTPKTGFQVGSYLFSPFKIKGLMFQAEYNEVASYTYSFTAKPNQNYSHFSQPLAHPLGAGFKEYMLFAHYHFKDFFILLHYSSAKQENNEGENIFTEQPPLPTTPPEANFPNTISYKSVEFGYLFNKTTNFQLFLGFKWRNEILPAYKALHIYAGVKTNLNNYYYDF